MVRRTAGFVGVLVALVLLTAQACESSQRDEILRTIIKGADAHARRLKSYKASFRTRRACKIESDRSAGTDFHTSPAACAGQGDFAILQRGIGD